MIHSPSISRNLLSINKLCRDNLVSFNDSSVCVKDRRTSDVVTIGQGVDGLYQLNLNKHSRRAEVNSVDKGSMDLWHARLGHLNEKTTKLMIHLISLCVIIFSNNVHPVPWVECINYTLP